MTTNATVIITDTVWTDVHNAAGIAAGTSLDIQIKIKGNTAARFINATVAPINEIDSEDGGVETSTALQTAISSPSAGESTFARSRRGDIELLIQGA